MLNLTLKQLSVELSARRVSSVEVAEFFLKRINTLGKTLNAFVCVDTEKTLAAAQAADRMIAAGQAGPLTGVPVMVMVCCSTAAAMTSSTVTSLLVSVQVPIE